MVQGQHCEHFGCVIVQLCFRIRNILAPFVAGTQKTQFRFVKVRWCGINISTSFFKYAARESN